MYIIISVSILALLLTFLETIGFIKHGMKLGFILLTLLAIIHYDYGNDYMAYYHIYTIIIQTPFQWDALMSVTNKFEIGWTLLCYAFKSFGGFFMLIAVLSIFQNILFYKMIKRYVPKNYWTFSVFIYLFNTSFYVLNFSMLRQGLVIAIFFSLWPIIENKKWIKTLFVILILTTIHSSAIILLPFAFWGYLPIKNGKKWSITFFILFIVLSISITTLSYLFFRIIGISEIFETYQEFYGESDNIVTYGLGYIITLLSSFLAPLLYISKSDNDSMKRLVLLFCINFIIILFTRITPLVSRLSFYFIVYSIIALPITYANMTNNILKKSLLSLYIIFTLYSYFLFFKSPIYIEKYTTFNTIFSLL